MTLRRIATLVTLAVAPLTGGQAIENGNEPEPPHYDAELARKLGADELGMRTYVLAILKTGPQDGSIKGEERQEIFKGHFANMTRLAGEGKLAVAGPFGENTQSFRGLFILAVPTVDEAMKLAETDPAIQAGIFVVDYLPWYGSAALMQANEIHHQIAQSGL